MKSLLKESDLNLENISVKTSIKKYLSFVILAPIFKSIEAVFDLLIPLIMKHLLDTIEAGTLLTDEHNLRYALICGGIILLLGILGFCSTMVCQFMASVASIGVATDLRNKLFRKVCMFSSKENEKFPKGYIHTVLNSDVIYLQNAVSMAMRLLTRTPILVVGALVISFIYSWQLALLFLCIVPIVLIIVFVFMNKVSKQYGNIQTTLDKINGVTTDNLKGSRVIRAFNKQEYENEKFSKINEKYLNIGKKITILSAFINPLTFAVVNIVTILIVYLAQINVSGSVNFLGGELEVTTIITLVNYLEQIFQALVVFANVVNIINRGIVCGKRINEILKLNIDIKDDKSKLTVLGEDYEDIIKFDHVFVSYEEGDNYSLEDINFSIKKGESVGIIGGTGSGKSSLINLMLRYVDARKGNVYFKGHNVTDINLATLREAYGLVLQKAVLFNGTIKSNMQVSNPNVTDERIIEALKTSLAYDFVSLYKDNINHEVLEGGRNFSGGQKQRLSIARTLCKDNEILILDDSTNALDYISELKVRQNINNKYNNLTKIIISQRVSSVQACDKIIVMENGKISSIGNHEYLLNNNDIYRETYLSQIKGDNI